MSILRVNSGKHSSEAAPRRISSVGRGIISWVVVLALVLFILGPLVVLFLWAFADAWFYPALLPHAWTFSWWQQILLNEDISHSILLSFVFAPVVTLVSAVICLPASYAFA